MSITLTEAARARLIAYLEMRGGDTVQFTLDGRGCGGMSYVLDVIDRANVASADLIVPLDEARILAADHTVLPFIAGTVIDWSEGLAASAFTFQNPQAAASCGCGSSFSQAGGCGA